MPKLRLGINIDHVATIRNARKRHHLAEPDLLRASVSAVKGGADSITFHLREDRRHVMDEDVGHLIKSLKTMGVPINLEMAATVEMEAIARRMKPDAICLVPEKRREVTTEGGLDVVRGGSRLAALINRIAAQGSEVALFINPDIEQVMAAYISGASAIELHTGTYCEAKGAQRRRELNRLNKAASLAHGMGLEVHAGHGLSYANVADIAKIPEIVELNIGHFLIGEAVFVGLENAVRTMRRILTKARA